MMLNQLCLYQFKEDCNDIIEGVKATRLDGNDLDPFFEPDITFSKMNSE